MIFLLKVFKRYLKVFWQKYRIYRKFGLILPQGCVFNAPENIKLSKPFSLAENCMILAQDKGSEIVAGRDLRLNANVTLNADCQGKIILGENVLMGPGVVLRASNHRFANKEQPINSQGHDSGTITIEDDVWLGANVVVLPNVTIGRGSVIAAGAVVSKDVAAYTIAGGVPAKKIKER